MRRSQLMRLMPILRLTTQAIIQTYQAQLSRLLEVNLSQQRIKTTGAIYFKFSRMSFMAEKHYCSRLRSLTQTKITVFTMQKCSLKEKMMNMINSSSRHQGDLVLGFLYMK